jgi:uncharacterized protein (TIGR00255 family)
MTGFGRGVFADGQRTVTVEIRSVNHRYSDITIKMPRRYQFAEDAIKGVLKESISRGKVDVSVNVENTAASDVEVSVDLGLAKQYHDALLAIAAAFPRLKDDVSVGKIASMPDVLKTQSAEEDEDSFTAAVCAATREAADAFAAMRAAEGARLIEDVLQRNDLIEATVTEVEKYAPNVEKLYAERMKERITELLDGQAAIPQDRILLEAAVFADKANITEEIVRLKSHCAQLRAIVADSSAPVGKKLDFLVQEMNRESNTIGSKANDINITNSVLVLKAEIEKIREQIQNIE